DLFVLAHVSSWSVDDLFADRRSQAAGRSSSSATCFIGFSARCGAPGAGKAAFLHQQSHRVSSSVDLSFRSKPTIMDLPTLPLTMRAGHGARLRDHLDADRSVNRAVLFQHVQVRQLQWDHDPCVQGSLFSVAFGMLIWQGLVLLFLTFVFFSGSTKNKPLFCFSSLFSPLTNSSIPRKDGEPTVSLTMHVNASKSRNAPIYFCGDSGHSNTVNAEKIDTLVWDDMVRLSDEIELIERAIQLATNNNTSLRKIAAIERSIVNSQGKIAQYTEDIANPALKGQARDVILGLLSDEYTNLQSKQEEKSLVEAGIIDTQRLAGEAQKILVWCKTVKGSREELMYQQKRDFMRLLGIRVFIDKSDKRREDLIWRIEATLPEIQELIMSNTYKAYSAVASVTHMSTCYP